MKRKPFRSDTESYKRPRRMTGERDKTETPSTADAKTPKLTASAIAYQRFKERHEILHETFGGMTLERQMEEFVSTVTLGPGDMALRERVLNDLMTVLKPYYWNVQLHPFGSLISGLGEKDSDLDVFVDCHGDSMYGGRSKSRNEKVGIFKQVLRILRENQYRGHQYFQQVIQIPAARVPIIKFIHSHTSLHCDVSFENMLSIRNSQLVQFLVQLDPRVRPLTCLIRYWGKFHQLTDSLKVKNYAITLLVLVFLADKRILPTVYQLQHWPNAEVPPFRVDFWNASFYTNREDILNTLDVLGRPPVEYDEFGHPSALSILELALGFFQFYQNFPADTHILCTLTGQFIPRFLFEEVHESQLPEELNDYKLYCASEFDCDAQANATTEVRRLNVNPRMTWIIQDPFALNFNVGAVTKDNILSRFLRACAVTATNLSALLESWKSSTASANMLNIFCDVDFRGLPKNRTQQMNLVQKGVKAGRAENDNGETQVTDQAGDQNGNPMKAEVRRHEYQKFLEFQPPQSFKDAFYEKFAACPDTSNLIVRKGKVLWITFMKDFFRLFFSKCYGLNVQIDEITPMSSKDSPTVQNDKMTKSNDSKVVEKQDHSLPVAKEVLETSPDNNVDYLAFLKIPNASSYPNPFLLPVPTESPSTATTTWTVEDQPTSMGMAQTTTKRSSSSRDLQPLSPSSKPPPTKLYRGPDSERRNENDSKTISDDKGTKDPAFQKLQTIDEEQYKPFQLILHCSGDKVTWEGRVLALKQIRQGIIRPPTDPIVDPMDIEAEITKRLQGNPFVFQFDAEVTFEPSPKNLVVQMILKAASGTKRDLTRSKTAIKILSGVLQDMHEKYVLFRLTNCLKDLGLPSDLLVARPPVIQPKTKSSVSLLGPLPGPPNPLVFVPHFGFGRGRGSYLYPRVQQIPPSNFQLF